MGQWQICLLFSQSSQTIAINRIWCDLFILAGSHIFCAFDTSKTWIGFVVVYNFQLLFSSRLIISSRYVLKTSLFITFQMIPDDINCYTHFTVSFTTMLAFLHVHIWFVQIGQLFCQTNKSARKFFHTNMMYITFKYMYVR